MLCTDRAAWSEVRRCRILHDRTETRAAAQRAEAGLPPPPQHTTACFLPLPKTWGLNQFTEISYEVCEGPWRPNSSMSGKKWRTSNLCGGWGGTSIELGHKSSKTQKSNERWTEILRDRLLFLSPLAKGGASMAINQQSQCKQEVFTWWNKQIFV